jgi:hypothetical protein
MTSGTMHLVCRRAACAAGKPRRDSAQRVARADLAPRDFSGASADADGLVRKRANNFATGEVKRRTVALPATAAARRHVCGLNRLWRRGARAIYAGLRHYFPPPWLLDLAMNGETSLVRKTGRVSCRL